MKSEVWRHPVTVFTLRFAIIFGLLIFPWPGWNAAYGEFFRGLGNAAFSRDAGARVVEFSGNKGPAGPHTLDTGILVANRDLLDANGKGRGKINKLDSRSIGWVPTALTVALIAATPIPWRRRLGALAGGLVLVHLYILFCLQAWIWNRSTEVALLTLSDFWKIVVDDLSYTLIDQIGASFAIPVLIWILVSFNGEDLLKRSNEKRNAAGAGPSATRSPPFRRGPVPDAR